MVLQEQEDPMVKGNLRFLFMISLEWHEQNFLKKNSKTFKKLKLFKNRVENEPSLKIKYFRSDRGSEFNIFCEENSIKRQLSGPRTPEINDL